MKSAIVTCSTQASFGEWSLQFTQKVKKACLPNENIDLQPQDDKNKILELKVIESVKDYFKTVAEIPE